MTEAILKIEFHRTRVGIYGVERVKLGGKKTPLGGLDWG